MLSCAWLSLPWGSLSDGARCEADAVAWWSTLNAGYPPEAAASFFKKLDGNAAPLPSAASWLSTHPATKDRIVLKMTRQLTCNLA